MLLFSHKRQEISLSETFTTSSRKTHPRFQRGKKDWASTDFTRSSSHQVFTCKGKAVLFPLQPALLDPAAEQAGSSGWWPNESWPSIGVCFYSTQHQHRHWNKTYFQAKRRWEMPSRQNTPSPAPGMREPLLVERAGWWQEPLHPAVRLQGKFTSLGWEEQKEFDVPKCNPVGCERSRRAWARGRRPRDSLTPPGSRRPTAPPCPETAAAARGSGCPQTWAGWGPPRGRAGSWTQAVRARGGRQHRRPRRWRGMEGRDGRGAEGAALRGPGCPGAATPDPQPLSVPRRALYPCRGAAWRRTCGFPAGASQLPIDTAAPRGHPGARHCRQLRDRGPGAAEGERQTDCSHCQRAAAMHGGEEENKVNLHAFLSWFVFFFFTWLCPKHNQVRWNAGAELSLAVSVSSCGMWFWQEGARVLLAGTRVSLTGGRSRLNWKKLVKTEHYL